MAKQRRGASARPQQERATWEKKVHSYGLSVLRLDRLMRSKGPEPDYVTEVRVKCQPDAQGLFLAILKAHRGDEQLVGFYSAVDPSEAFRGILAKYDNGTLKLREDRPWSPSARE